MKVKRERISSPEIHHAPPAKAVHEIEPDMMVDGRVRYKLDQTESQALVIHCGDPRFQKAFRRFIVEELGLANYTPLIIGGGVHAFGMQAFLPKNFKVLWEQVKYHLKAGDLKQIIIINHEDCHWYEKMKDYRFDIQLPLQGKMDLKKAAMTIWQDFSGVSVRSFWAGIEGDHITFTEIK